MLIKKIIELFEPQFNSRSKKNVIGKPCNDIPWLSKSLGFTQLGDTCSESLVLNQKIFQINFLKLIDSIEQVDSKLCFELIHDAFDLAYRNNEKNLELEKILFYHLHNPNLFEHLNFINNFPNSKILYLFRNPIQMIESWVLSDLNELRNTQNFFKSIELIRNITNKICYPFELLNNPINSLYENRVRGVKLEDIKKKLNITIPIISNWIGIKKNNNLFKSEFMNKKFSRPSYNFDNISGFDTRAIEVPIGKFFGNQDIQILETLLWPFLKNYGYTKKSKTEFTKNLDKIKPLLGQPLEFELKLKKQKIFKNKNIHKIEAFKKMHQQFFEAHQLLTEKNTYPHIMRPL